MEHPPLIKLENPTLMEDVPAGPLPVTEFYPLLTGIAWNQQLAKITKIYLFCTYTKTGRPHQIQWSVFGDQQKKLWQVCDSEFAQIFSKEMQGCGTWGGTLMNHFLCLRVEFILVVAQHDRSSLESNQYELQIVFYEWPMDAKRSIVVLPPFPLHQSVSMDANIYIYIVVLPHQSVSYQQRSGLSSARIKYKSTIYFNHIT